MKNFQKNFTLLDVKSSSERLERSEKSFFKYVVILFCNLSSIFVIQQRLDPVSNRRFPKKQLQFLRKVFQMTAKLSKKQNFPNFDAIGDFAKYYKK